MVVVCESCSTRFRVDETRIPPKGTLVRCSRCKATFIVQAPEASFEETVQDVVAEVTGAGGPPTPMASEDLFETAPDDLGATQRGADEDAWEFDDDEPVPDTSPPRAAFEAPPREPPRAAFEAAPPEPLPAASQAASPEPPPAALEAAAPEPAAAAEPSPNAFDDIAREPPGGDAAAPSLEVEPTEPPAVAAAGLESASPETHPPALDEIGHPDDWDLLGDSIDAAASGAKFVEPEAEPESETPTAEAELEADLAATIEAAPAAVPASPAARGEGRRRLGEAGRTLFAAGRGALRVAAWCGVVAALGLGVLLVTPHGPRVQPVAATQEVHALPDGEARDVRVRFVENAFAGTLYVVQGEIERRGADTTIGLQVRWRDAAGTPLGMGAWAQPLPHDRALRERAPEAWDPSRVERLAAPTQGTFAAIFTELPAEAAGVSLSLEPLPARASEAPATGGPAGEAEAVATTPSPPSPLPSAE